MRPHQVRDDDCGRPADSSVAVNEHAPAVIHYVANELVAYCEMLLEIGRGRIYLTDPLVGELLGKFGVQTRTDRQDMSDTSSRKDVLIVGCYVIADEKPLEHLVERLNSILLARKHHLFSLLSYYTLFFIPLFTL